jgi:hypothetical protein
MKRSEDRAPSFLKPQRAATRGEPDCLARDSPAKIGRVSAFFLRVVVETPKKQAKAAAEHSQRMVEGRQAYRLTQ